MMMNQHSFIHCSRGTTLVPVHLTGACGVWGACEELSVLPTPFSWKPKLPKDTTFLNNNNNNKNVHQSKKIFPVMRAAHMWSGRQLFPLTKFRERWWPSSWTRLRGGSPDRGLGWALGAGSSPLTWSRTGPPATSSTSSASPTGQLQEPVATRASLRVLPSGGGCCVCESEAPPLLGGQLCYWTRMGLPLLRVLPKHGALLVGLRTWAVMLPH